MPRITKKIYTFEDAMEDFIIHCTNKDLSKKTMKSYESTLKSFAKYLEDEENIFIPTSVTTKHIKTYLKFTKNKGKYSYVAEVNTLYYNNPQNRGDFGKEISMWTVNNYLRNIKVFF